MRALAECSAQAVSHVDHCEAIALFPVRYGLLRATSSMAKEIRMDRKTILYISDQTTCGDAISDALNAAGYEVVTTNTTEAVALLYVLHSIAAVVLRARKQDGLDVRSIRAICPDVPIVLLCRGRTNFVPSRVDTGDTDVATVQSPATLAAAVRRLVAKKPATPCPRRPESSRKRGH
jgi:DNA-binding NtrC family response regulator